ncbi:EamA family transporter [Fodinicola feengrottensis]|uniref:EamA family transporter n=1 Tax=Fodinicola feengrottensis TaxID=435914 RepID=A0ABN2FZU8_9ACTN
MAMGLIWGVPYLLIKLAVAEVSAPMLVFVRTAVGAAVLAPLALRAGGWDLLRRHWKPLVAFALLEILGPWWLLADAERTLPSSTTGLLIAAVPIVGAVVSRLTGDAERLSRSRWVGLLLGLAGVAVLAAPDLRAGSVVPVLEVLLVVVGYSTAPLIAARKLKDVPSLPMTVACLTGAALVYAPAAVATWPKELPSGYALGALAGLAVICTALAFVVFFALIREVGPSRAMVFTYFNPAVAVLAGLLVLGEPLTLSVGGAFALILAGSLLATAGTRQPLQPQPEPSIP